MIDYEYFLSRRFDLVIRYHLLRATDFDGQRAKTLVNSDKYRNLRDISGKLLKGDMNSKKGIMKKVKNNNFKGPLGDLVARQLFYQPNWNWIDNEIRKGQEWIDANPYDIRIDVLGLSVKRFLLTMKHKRTLSWVFKTHGKTPLELWKKQNYKELLETSEFNSIQKSQNLMMIRMKKLKFFSLNTYKGGQELLEKYKRDIQT